MFNLSKNNTGSVNENVDENIEHTIKSSNPYDESLKESIDSDLEAPKMSNNRYPDLLNAPKRKVALLLAYQGTEYFGLQCNRGDRSLPTVEGKLFDALANAKVVPELCVEKPGQMKYASASRTDKGVSTCGQVVSLKLRYNEQTMDLINDHLPRDIRVIDIRRVTQGFNAKLKASGRTYAYTTPTFAFANISEQNKDYRITEGKLKLISEIMSKYKGTHSFHNFTSGKLMTDASAKRYIIDFWLEKPVLYKEYEFITLKIKGQSFMMHQIRKMIGLLITLITGYADNDHLKRAFSEPLADIPKAPGTGLVLMKVHFDAYNKQHEHTHGNLEWESSQERLTKFYNEFIMPVIHREEVENNCMLSWLQTLPNHDYSGETAKIQWQEQLNLKKNSEIIKDAKFNENDKLLCEEKKLENIKANREQRLKRNIDTNTKSDIDTKKIKLPEAD